jgi:TolB-like protein
MSRFFREHSTLGRRERSLVAEAIFFALRRYATNDRDPIRVGRDLGVESVLDGTIHRDGQRLRVTARLLLVRDGSRAGPISSTCRSAIC